MDHNKTWILYHLLARNGPAMPKSRKRKRKAHHANPSDPLALESMFDGPVRSDTSDEVPRVLHHYTTWDGAAGILSSQQFWATDHRCTNDVAELVSADSVIIEIAKELRCSAFGTAAKALDFFISEYERLHISESLTVCLVCFSLARDHDEQWRRYGENGHGICLSLRVLDEPPPQHQASRTLRVDYSEPSWREAVRTDFRKVCDVLSRSDSIARNIRLGVSALNRRAAVQCMLAKKPGWAVEQEVRHVTLVPPGSASQLRQRETSSGTKRYLPVRVRTEGKQIALAEILIGPNRDAEKTRRDLEDLLFRCGYKVGSEEYPVISPSRIRPWDRETL
jgi:hypothetical protein